jgi:hypothetical protein
MDLIITIIGYISIVILFILYIFFPFLFLWFIYQGVIKPFIELFRKKA